MEKQSNTGWYVLGGLALLFAIGYHMGRGGQISPDPVTPIDPNAAPDTASSTEIIITPGK